MVSRENSRIFFRQLWKDRAIRWFLAIFILLHLPYFIFDQATPTTDRYGVMVAALFLFPVLIYVLWPHYPSQFTERERLFWRVLSLIFWCWWLVNAMYLLIPAGWWTGHLDIGTDLLFVIYYAGWLGALSLTPHATGKRKLNRTDRLFLMAAPVVLTIGLIFYFFLIPIRLAPETYESWVPSLLLFTGIDIVLLLVLVALTVRARSPRWRFLYSALATTHALFACLDLLEALNYTWVYQWAETASSDILWSFPFVLLVIIARARGYDFPVAEKDEDSRYPARDILEASISPVIMVSFVLPVTHISLDQLGLLEESMRGPQATVVLGSLILFWMLAIFENVALRLSTEKSRKEKAELEQLRVKQFIAESTEKTKQRFLANVSHEIRTPLNGILGMSDILLRGKLEAEQHQHAMLLKTSAQEMVNVVDDILEYSKIEAGELRLVIKPFRLDQLATDIIGLFGATEMSESVELALEIDDDVPLELEGDSSRLRQVLINLLANAIKFTAEGEVRLQISLRDRSNETVRLICKVSDTGIGIEPDAPRTLFQPFTQGDESKARKYGGSGLGLSIAKQIVEAHGGEIGAYGKPEGGSVFWFEVPLKISGPQPDVIPDPDHQSVDPGSVGKILLAEDDEINLMVTLKQLELLGYEADVARDGNEVLRALDKSSYTLILMDCQMPALDGIQATRQIRQQGYSHSKLPIIALTANAFDEDREQCIEAGMNDFISKPAQLEDISSTLAKWI